MAANEAFRASCGASAIKSVPISIALHGMRVAMLSRRRRRVI
ncbi:MYXO-CTERM sorting domain-containing protein [Sphingomonas sp. MMS24-J45]